MDRCYLGNEWSDSGRAGTQDSRANIGSSFGRSGSLGYFGCLAREVSDSGESASGSGTEDNEDWPLAESDEDYLYDCQTRGVSPGEERKSGKDRGPPMSEVGSQGFEWDVDRMFDSGESSEEGEDFSGEEFSEDVSSSEKSSEEGEEYTSESSGENHFHSDEGLDEYDYYFREAATEEWGFASTPNDTTRKMPTTFF